jgi:hypothetical protein
MKKDNFDAAFAGTVARAEPWILNILIYIALVTIEVNVSSNELPNGPLQE